MRQPLSVSTDQLEEIARKQKDNTTAPSSLGATLKEPKSVPKEGSVERWAVPIFPDHVNVLEEKGRAFVEAKAFMDQLLVEDDMSVELVDSEEGEVPVGKIINLETGVEINRYQGMDLLKLYAQNAKPCGLIVDGIV